MNEHENEPVRGLPAPLPKGETILWQGSPDWRVLAQSALHARSAAIYFGILIVWRVSEAALSGAGPVEALASAQWLLIAAAAGLGLLHLLAWLIARATIYTITNRRVVLRFGVAIQKAVNLPFKVIETAALKRSEDGIGDIAICLARSARVAYLQLWPHVRPGRMAHPQPALRAVPRAGVVAQILAEALAGDASSLALAGDATSPAQRALPQPALA